MTREADVVQLLIDAGVLSNDDAKSVETLKGEALLQHMIDRRVLLPSEIEEAREYLVNALTSTNHIQRMHSKISLVKVITANLHRRMGDAGDQLRTSRDKFSSSNYAAVASAAVALKSTGER